MPLSKGYKTGRAFRARAVHPLAYIFPLEPSRLLACGSLAVIWNIVVFGLRSMLVIAAVSCSLTQVRAQTEDPSDVSASLTSNVNDALFAAFPICSGVSLNGPFSLSTVSTATVQSDNLPYAPCAYAPGVPAPPMPAKDIWFRMDPAFSDASFRFTLYGTGSPTMTKGGIAVYEALNATGPFRLLDCSLGGSLTNLLPTVEASGITTGYKIYIRVWDASAVPVNSNFNICVRGQRASNLLLPAFDRGADETPCGARTLSAVGLFSSSGALFNYVHAVDEAGTLPTTPEKAGGDLWVKILIPPVGHVRLRASYGTNPANQIGAVVTSKVSGSFGVSAYLATNCADLATFREVGSTTELVSPVPPPTGLPMELKCLPAGQWLYVRLYALKEATTGTKVKRFGQFRLEWMPGPLPYPLWTPSDRPANCDPCGASDLTMDAPCTGSSITGGSTAGACSVPGIPFPLCGGFTAATQSVWHKFVAPLSGSVVIDAKGAGATPISPAIALYTSNEQGCDGRMALIACDDRQGPGQDARIVKFELVVGQTYYIRTWSRSTEGTFSLCVSEPTAPAGSCLYLIDLWSALSSGVTTMDVSINGGPATTYTPSGGDMSQLILIPIPLGASADFSFNATGGSGYYYYGLWQFGQPETLWWGDGGYAVSGPAPIPVTTYALASACQPIVHPPSDCRGMRTICLSGPASTYPVTGTIENRPKPRHPGPSTNAGAYSDYGSTDYNGYTYNVQNGNAYDLAGANLGCLSPERNGIEWVVFRPEADGSVGFLLNANKGTPAPSGPVDLDFAIWDLGALVYTGTDSINGDLVCPPRTAPLRCSSARSTGSTGLVAGMSATSEGNGGYGWLKPLPVLSGHGYLIAIMPVGVVGAINYTLNWTLYRNALGVSDPSILMCEPLALPIELLFLAGQQRENVVDLTWATATEKNSSHFIVERSSNALDFTPVGTVAASGNSQYRIDYALTDPSPMGGVNYYRLQLIDLDGTRETSNVIAVMFSGDGSRVLAWPNPVRDVLNIGADLSGPSVVHVQVMDALGRTVQRNELPVEQGQDRLELDTRGLASGSYIVHVNGPTGIPIGTAHFVKQ